MEQVKPFTTVHGTSQTIYNSTRNKSNHLQQYIEQATPLTTVNKSNYLQQWTSQTINKSNHWQQWTSQTIYNSEQVKPFTTSQIIYKPNHLQQVNPFTTCQTIYNKSNHLQQVKPFTTSQTIYNKSNYLQQVKPFITSQTIYNSTEYQPILRKVWRDQWKTEALNQRTEKTMAKGKRKKRQTIIYKTLHIKLTIEQQKPH